MNKKKFVKSARLPKQAHAKSLNEVLSPYAKQGAIREISARLQKEGWKYNEDQYRYELWIDGELVFKTDMDSYPQNPSELSGFLRDVYASLGWDEERVSSQVRYILTGKHSI